MSVTSRKNIAVENEFVIWCSQHVYRCISLVLAQLINRAQLISQCVRDVSPYRYTVVRFAVKQPNPI